MELLQTQPVDTETCVHCGVPLKHPVWRDVQRVYAQPYGEKVQSRLKRIQQLEGVLAKYPELECSVATLQRHRERHNQEQPHPPVQVKHRAEKEAYGLLPRQVELLTYVAQMGKAGRLDTAQQFHTSTSRASTMLNRLANMEYLYRVQKPSAKATKRKGPTRVAFYLTPLGQAILNELQRGTDETEHWLNMKTIVGTSSVGQLALNHDLGCSQLVSLLREQATAKPEYVLKTRNGERRFQLSVRRENCLGYGQLSLGHKVAGYREGQVHRQRTTQNVIPDAFMALGVREEDGLDVALGFFFEYDTGTKWAKAVGRDQLFSYVTLDRSPEQPVGKRLPDFTGLQVPVLLSTEDDTERPRETGQADSKDARRAQHIIGAFNSKLSSVSWARSAAGRTPPILLALTPELKAHGWETLVWCLHLPGTPRYPLLAALLAAYEPYLAQLPLRADGVARLALDEGKAYYGAEQATMTSTELRAQQLRAAAEDRRLDQLAVPARVSSDQRSAS